ncbi:MAG: hypothetical protein OEU54_14705 [Gemmatimonadota bacterium]|nr:hypothetical protein [Gemmatimonadota bacterium]
MAGYQVNGGGEDETRPQLGMWDDSDREQAIGSLEDSGKHWQTLVLLEQMSGDLVRGRLSFRHGEERYDTAPVILEETAARVVRRAIELPKAMLLQLLISARE